MKEEFDYIDTRVVPRLAWYDKRAVRYKRLSAALQYLAVIASIGVLILLHRHDVDNFVIACVAALAALVSTVERIGQFGVLWRQYRLCAEALEMETHLYKYASGSYNVDPESRKRLLVERTEAILAREAMDWGAVVTAARSVAEEANIHKS